MRQRIGTEEAGNTVGDRRPVGELLVEARKELAEIPDLLLLHALPEFAQARQPVLGLVAGDQAGIDGADRGADDPVRLDAGLVQGLVDARLIRAKRAAALQHEDDLAGQGFACLWKRNCPACSAPTGYWIFWFASRQPFVTPTAAFQRVPAVNGNAASLPKPYAGAMAVCRHFG